MKNIFFGLEVLLGNESILLHHLSFYTQPFTAEEVFNKEKSIEEDELNFYQLFFSLEFDGYIQAVNSYSILLTKAPLLSEMTFKLTGNGKFVAQQIS